MPAEKKKAQKIPAPKTLEEAAAYGRRIGELLRSIHTFEDTFEAERAAIDKREDEAVYPLQQEALALAKSIYVYAARNRMEITQDEKRKTISLPQNAGTLQWYSTPPAVMIKEAAEVLANIKKLGLRQFIRTKEEVNKDAMLEEQELAQTVTGVSISKQEKFAIRPTGTKERLECNTGTKRWKFAMPSS